MKPRSNDPTGRWVDQLIDAAVTVVVISPNQLKNLRGRARNNLDRHPNYILAAYMASGT